MLTATDMTRIRKGFVPRDEHESAFNFLSRQIIATQTSVENLEIKVDQKFEAMDQKFTGLIERVEDKFDKKFDQIIVTLDNLAGSVQNMRLENSVSAAQYARQVEWNHRVAEKIDVPFEY